MSKDREPDSAPKPAPAPQLPNIPISPDDPFQSDPDLLPPVAPASDPGPAPSGQSPGRGAIRPPAPDDPDDAVEDRETSQFAINGERA